MLCVKLRNSLMHTFYSLPNMREFVLDIILGCPSQDVRLALLSQLTDLCQEVRNGKTWLGYYCTSRGVMSVWRLATPFNIHTLFSSLFFSFVLFSSLLFSSLLFSSLSYLSSLSSPLFSFLLYSSLLFSSLLFSFLLYSSLLFSYSPFFPFPLCSSALLCSLSYLFFSSLSISSFFLLSSLWTLPHILFFICIPVTVSTHLCLTSVSSGTHLLNCEAPEDNRVRVSSPVLPQPPPPVSRESLGDQD